MICKLQKPLFPTPPEGKVLAYTKHRKFECFVPWSPLLDSMFEVFGLEFYFGAKFFAECHVDETTNELVIDKPLTTDEGW